MRLALVHDHLNQLGGAEEVLHVLHKMWPAAPLFVLIFDRKKMGGWFDHADVRLSFLSHLPFAHRLFQWYLPLMPAATEHYPLANFDVVVSSSSAFAKGIITKPHTLHICYCHTPTRYLWSDSREYVSELRVPFVIKWCLPPLLSLLRLWDRAAAERVDIFVANSQTVAGRIKKYYGRESTVIHPPVDVSRFSVSKGEKDYFLTGGRLVAYKRFDVVVDACTRTGFPLKVFGTGPVEAELRRRAGPSVEFLGRVSNEEQARLYQGARAFIHPQEEDFGITPVEAMASGCPVIAFRRGGAVETIREGVTGTFFDEQTWERLASTIIEFHEDVFDPETVRAHALQYSKETFEREFRALVEEAHQRHARTL
ncbi:glycosyltransferase [Candidatus Uhrbacteria bacterium]|nr:glycosyltransferase [Candidatus Uhrbacteria bacterium]